MFMKASGEQVWLRTPASLPYLAASGKMVTALDHDALLRHLGDRYDPSGMCTNGASYFLGAPPKGPCLVFCLKPSKACAVLVLNTRRAAQEPHQEPNVLTSFLMYFSGWIERLEQELSCRIQITDIRNEISLPQQ
ncbi:hypothetical protein ACOXXX_15025 [Thalassococcus sp. BH17M4-6]|uniref:hypothetical protein n=1 Tax=Thalassococcus sp. BH17M4-6 TaxID=3413148 RepID=UPI003BD4FBAD